MVVAVSALLLSTGNVLLLLLRASVQTSAVEAELPAGPTPSPSLPVHRQPLSTESATKDSEQSAKPSNDTLAALDRGLSRCPNARRPSVDQIVRIQSVWQLQYIGVERIYVYSAYFDDRRAAGVLPSIRVLVLSTFRRNASIICSVWYGGIDQPFVVPVTVNSVAGSGYRFGRQIHREYAYICPLPISHPVPTDVSVLGGRDTCPGPSGYSTLVPIQRTVPTRRQPVEFGVCVTAGYGYLEPEVLVEWVELNRLYGAAEINLYDVWYSKNMSTVFRYYQNLGVLRVHTLPHPRADHPSWFFNKVRNLRIIALNDCQLKYMYRYR